MLVEEAVRPKLGSGFAQVRHRAPPRAPLLDPPIVALSLSAASSCSCQLSDACRMHATIASFHLYIRWVVAHPAGRALACVRTLCRPQVASLSLQLSEQPPPNHLNAPAGFQSDAPLGGFQSDAPLGCTVRHIVGTSRDDTGTEETLYQMLISPHELSAALDLCVRSVATGLGLLLFLLLPLLTHLTLPTQLILPTSVIDGLVLAILTYLIHAIGLGQREVPRHHLILCSNELCGSHVQGHQHEQHVQWSEYLQSSAHEL